MIKKIKSFTLEKTEQQNDAEWSEILAFKYKLLSHSDWTQLLDSGLDEANIVEWRDWRLKIREINKREFDKENARSKLNELDNNKPSTIQKKNIINENYTFILEKTQLNSKIIKKYQSLLYNNVNFTSKDVLDEKYQQALEYISDGYPDDLTHYPLICTIAELENKTPREITQKFVNDKKQFIQNCIKAETFLFLSTKAIESAKTIDELATVRELIYGHRH